MGSKKSKKGKSRFGSNVSRTAEREKTKSKGFSYLNLPKGLKMYKEAPGRFKLDILPYKVTASNHPDYREDDPESAVKDELWYRRPIQVHRNIGASKETVICPKTNNKKCSICEEKDKQYQEGVESKDVIGKTSFRDLYFVVPIDHKDYDEVPHLWDISNYCFGDALNDELEENPKYGVFPDLEDGMTLNIRFVEESFGKNKFAKATRVDFKKRKGSYDESTIENLPSLDEIFTVRSYKDLQKLFFEMDDEDMDDENAEEDAPFDTDDKSSKKRKKKGKKKERPSPDFSEKPKKKKKKSKKDKS